VGWGVVSHYLSFPFVLASVKCRCYPPNSSFLSFSFCIPQIRITPLRGTGDNTSVILVDLGRAKYERQVPLAYSLFDDASSGFDSFVSSVKGMFFRPKKEDN
jgi:hypothetical protein